MAETRADLCEGRSVLRVDHDDAGMRLDRWIMNRYPVLPHSHLSKLLRTGKIRVCGKRSKISDRLVAGQDISVPMHIQSSLRSHDRTVVPQLSPSDRKLLQESRLFEDEDILILNKPSGLAVQSGTGVLRHMDGLLSALGSESDAQFRLVHRLDQDTSGILVVAKSRFIASELARLFAACKVQKLYLALVNGVPSPKEGRVERSMVKGAGYRGERMGVVSGVQGENVQPAMTDYSCFGHSVDRLVTGIALRPVTGRQHQLRVHMASIGHPILYDRKYGDRFSLSRGDASGKRYSPSRSRLHLHARRVRFAHPRGGVVDVTADLPKHMTSSFAFWNIDPNIGHVDAFFDRDVEG